ncbi:MAG: U32 family peptidase [Bacteroidaceae bacterium]|nr:U32 family peptidase [Bacteroidaceae bacterium]
MSVLELLSPARNLESGIAAIDHGADAVYIGAARFGARAAAGNSTDDIRQLCDYAHLFGAKIYATINTLLREDEREQARLLAWDLYHAGVDALIVQDPILLELDLPPIPLHASTQMDNRTEEKVRELNKLGFRQIVLARELSLEQIRSIHKAVPEVTLEAFVHGALCVSYSGRCYASEYCFGRSANRGECAQFCRLPFSLEDAEGNTLIKDKYLLSLRDMNRINRLEELIDAGVRSFKIEGRLKDVDYVKNVTAAYRQALDAIMQRRPEFVRSSYGTSTYTFQPDLARSFSRGSTEYFLDGRTNDLAEPNTPKSRGREVGQVKEVRRDCVIVSSTETFSNGDGLCFFDGEGKLQGFRVNRAEGNHLYFNSSLFLDALAPRRAFNARNTLHSSLKKGDRLWRSFDKRWDDLMSGKTAERRISARFLLEETEKGFRLSFTAEDGTQRSEEFAQEHQLARTDQTASIREVLSKLGDTPYICQEVEIRFSQPWFIPRSILAEWRRKATPSKPPRGKALNPHFTKTQISPSPSGETEGGRPLMLCRFCLRHAWGQCHKANEKLKMKNEQWKEPLYLVLGDGRRFRLEFDCKRCEMKVLRS